jgi:hypothetical protein
LPHGHPHSKETKVPTTAAQDFLRAYPTPRALRQAVRERNIHDILREHAVLDCVAIADNGSGEQARPLAYWLAHGGLDLYHIHSAIHAAAQQR